MPSADSAAVEQGARRRETPAARRGGVRRLLAGTDSLSKLMAYVACVCLALMVVLLCVEIASRAFSSESPFSTWEYAGYLQGALVLLGAGYALKTGAQIRVNLLLSRLGPRGLRVVDVLCSVIGLAVMAPICWALFELFMGSLKTGSRSYFVSATPLWIPQAVLWIASVLLALQFAMRALKGVLGLPPEHDEEGFQGFGAE